MRSTCACAGPPCRADCPRAAATVPLRLRPRSPCPSPPPRFPARRRHHRLALDVGVFKLAAAHPDHGGSAGAAACFLVGTRAHLQPPALNSTTRTGSAAVRAARHQRLLRPVEHNHRRRRPNWPAATAAHVHGRWLRCSLGAVAPPAAMACAGPLPAQRHACRDALPAWAAACLPAFALAGIQPGRLHVPVRKRVPGILRYVDLVRRELHPPSSTRGLSGQVQPLRPRPHTRRGPP